MTRPNRVVLVLDLYIHRLEKQVEFVVGVRECQVDIPCGRQQFFREIEVAGRERLELDGPFGRVEDDEKDHDRDDHQKDDKDNYA